MKCFIRKYGWGVPAASTFFGHVIVSVCIFRALPNNAKRAHLIYLGLHLSTCNRTACICWNDAKCQAALYKIDGVVHMSVSPLTLVNHLSKGAFNRPLTHNTDTIHLHSHTLSQILLCAAQGCCHLLLKYIFGNIWIQNIVRTKSLA